MVDYAMNGEESLHRRRELYKGSVCRNARGKELRLARRRNRPNKANCAAALGE